VESRYGGNEVSMSVEKLTKENPEIAPLVHTEKDPETPILLIWGGGNPEGCGSKRQGLLEIMNHVRGSERALETRHIKIHRREYTSLPKILRAGHGKTGSANRRYLKKL